MEIMIEDHEKEMMDQDEWRETEGVFAWVECAIGASIIAGLIWWYSHD